MYKILLSLIMLISSPNTQAQDVAYAVNRSTSQSACLFIAITHNYSGYWQYDHDAQEWSGVDKVKLPTSELRARLDEYSEFLSDLDLPPPAAVVGHPGMFGSPLPPRLSESLEGVRLISAAIDEIIYPGEQLCLFGHSQSAVTVAGLLTLRSDIACATMASGPYDKASKLIDIGIQKSFYNNTDYFNPVNHIDDLILDGTDIQFVLDPKDQVVDLRYQRDFINGVADKTIARGEKTTVVIAEALDEKHHATGGFGLMAAARCVKMRTENQE